MTEQTTSSADGRPVALVTASCRGPGLDLLLELCDVHYDPWIDQQPLRILNGAQLADRIDEIGATVLVCEADSVKGPVLDRPLGSSARPAATPPTSTSPAPRPRASPCCAPRAATPTRVAELAVGLLLAVTRHVVPADRDVRAGEVYRDGTIPYQRYRAWQLAGQTAGIVGLGAVGRAATWRLEGLGMRVIAYDPYAPDATHDARRPARPRPTSCRCTPRSPPTRSA